MTTTVEVLGKLRPPLSFTSARETSPIYLTDTELECMLRCLEPSPCDIDFLAARKIRWHGSMLESLKREQELRRNRKLIHDLGGKLQYQLKLHVDTTDTVKEIGRAQEAINNIEKSAL